MPDFTRDEWDDQQEGWDPNGLIMSWTCDGCGCDTYEPFFEEGDRVECENCNIVGDAKEYYWEYNVDVNFDVEFPRDVADVAAEAIRRHLQKG